MDFFFGIIFRQNIDHLIRDKRFWMIVSMIFIIFGLFLAVDLISGVAVENYHAGGRIFFPPEFTRKLIFFQVTAFLLAIPFISALSVCLNSDPKRESLIFLMPYSKLKIAVQRITAVLTPVLFIQLIFCAIYFLSMKFNNDTTGLTIFYSQSVFTVYTLFFICGGFLWGVLFRSSFCAILINCGLTVLFVFNVYIIGPVLSNISDPKKIINCALVVNPYSIISSAINYDVMRSGFLYQTAQAVMYRFDYPSVGSVMVLFSILSAILFFFYYYAMRKSKNVYLNMFTGNSRCNIKYQINPEEPINLIISNSKESVLKRIFSDRRQKSKKRGNIFAGMDFVPFLPPMPFDWETPEFYLSYFAQLYGEKPEKTAILLKESGLDEVAHTKLKDLNESQKRLLVLLRSLIGKSEFVLWDDPFVAIDEDSQRRALDVLRSHLKEGAKAVIVSSTLSDLLSYKKYDRVIYICDEEICFDLASDKINEGVLTKIFSGREHEYKNRRQ